MSGTLQNYPSASVKRNTLLYLAEKYALKCFVETGTYRGDTTAVLAKRMATVHTIELSSDLCAAAINRFSSESHVHCWHGSSGTLLEAVLRQCPDPALIWLDGHYSGGITALGEEVSPILKEILHVANSKHAEKHVILIDDARLFDGKDYPLLNDALDWIKHNLPHHRAQVYADMIFVEPPNDASQMTREALSMGYNYAPRKVISPDDAYRLLLCDNFDREAAWRAGYEDADCVSAVYVSSACRLGNSIRQLAFALGVAMHHELHRVYLPGFWWLQEGCIRLENGIEIINAANTVMSDEAVLLAGEFFDVSGLHEFSSASISHSQALDLVKAYLTVELNDETLSENHLAILMRSGDLLAKI